MKAKPPHNKPVINDRPVHFITFLDVGLIFELLVHWFDYLKLSQQCQTTNMLSQMIYKRFCRHQRLTSTSKFSLRCSSTTQSVGIWIGMLVLWLSMMKFAVNPLICESSYHTNKFHIQSYVLIEVRCLQYRVTPPVYSLADLIINKVIWTHQSTSCAMDKVSETKQSTKFLRNMGRLTKKWSNNLTTKNTKSIEKES